MLNFFTKLLTPLFIVLGVVSAPVEMPVEVQPSAQQEIIELRQKIQNLEFEKEEVKIIVEPVQEKEVVKETIKTEIKKSAYIPPIAEEEIIVDVPILSNEESMDTKLIDAECGFSSNIILFENYREEELCLEGMVSDILNERGLLKWRCNSENEEFHSAICSSYMKTNAECGEVSNMYEIDFLQNSCKKGNFINHDIGNSNKHKWECDGLNGGENVHCSEYIKLDGVCAFREGCFSGNVAGKSISGDITRWQCTGVNGGINEQCLFVKCSGSACA